MPHRNPVVRAVQQVQPIVTTQRVQLILSAIKQKKVIAANQAQRGVIQQDVICRIPKQMKNHQKENRVVMQ